ncbi:hypothetical protein TanjilG_12878 [Lupinus angustifolius]|uniref:Uncharacterized protein n=2 Tax=Lupinus angustifolius TaxID=3871 RepID=A0A1J7GNG2_LUPAN|nr:hypothetical protein TanjilG_12878 [Lupinus angustifolius]
MKNKSHQSPTLFTTNTTSSRGASTSRNASRNNNGPNYIRQLNKHSNNISKPITKNLSISISPKNHAYSYNEMLSQLKPPLPPPVYKISKSEFKGFVQKVTGCTPKITAPPPPIRKTKPPSIRLQNIRPPPLMLMPPPLNTTIADHRNYMINFNPMNPINTINHFNPTNTNPMNPINNIDNVVAPPQTLPPLPSFSSESLGVDSPITSYLRFLNDSVLSSPIPLLSPSILFSPDVNKVGFQNLVPSPRWKDVQI